MNRFQNSLLMFIVISIAALFAGNLAAQEASPQPQDVFGYYSTFEKQLFLEWQIYERNDEIISFDCVLQQIEEDGNISAEYAFAFGINDANLSSQDGGEGRFYYNYLQQNYELKPGLYLITMKSFSENGESLPSSESYLWIDGGIYDEYIYFTEFPDTKASVGKPYVSSVKAESHDGQINIRYSLTEGPEGMTIDEESGLIEYTPAEGGNQSFVIRAYNADDNTQFTEAYFMIYVMTCENPAVISGKITYQESSKFEGGVLFIVQKLDDGLIMQTNGAEVGENGEFSVEVDKGEYYLYFMPFYGFGQDDFFNEGEWYKNALTIDQAEAVNVDCGETSFIEMLVGDQSLYTKFEVSGTVKMEDGTPIPYSTVMFESVASQDDPNNWGGYYRSVETDENGNYEILLPDAFSYRASCYANNYMNPGNFMPQYWENTYNPLEAAEIILTEDLTGINFTFKESDFEYPDGSISGKVVNTDGSPLAGAFVIAFMVKTLDGEPTNDIYQGFAGIANDQGEYRFDFMPYGEYIIFAYPNDMTYTPGFYREGEVAALTWEEASVIVHDGFNPLKNIDIILPLLEIVQGIGTIDGVVTSTGGGLRNDEVGEELAGASIFLVSENGVTNKYNKSSVNGTYLINGIAPGQYQLIVDKVGYKSHKELVEVGQNGIITDLNVALTPEGVSSVNDQNVSVGLNLYPNPAVNNIQLSINALTNSLSVEIYNMTGEKLLTQNINAISGEGIYSLNVSELSTGIYVIKVIDGQNVRLDKFIVNK